MATKKQFFLALSCYVHKKLKYELQGCIINVQKFQELISLNELITNF